MLIITFSILSSNVSFDAGTFPLLVRVFFRRITLLANSVMLAGDVLCLRALLRNSLTSNSNRSTAKVSLARSSSN